MEDWSDIAKSLGYENEKAMLEGLYHGEGWPISKLCRRLGVGNRTMIRHLKYHGIVRRGKGGANNPARIQNTLHRLDQRAVFGTPIRVLAKQLSAHPSTIWKYVKMITGGTFDEFRELAPTEPSFSSELSSRGFAPSDVKDLVWDKIKRGKEVK